MKAIQFVDEGLGNSSYVLDLGNDRAVAVDPDRSIARYADCLTANGLSLAGIFETHLHADFISGARELASRFGAPIFVAEEADARFPHQGLRGTQHVTLNGCEVEALASPGHTPEHLSYVFRSSSAPPVLFSGGALIVGGAARTDLIAPSLAEELTRAEFRTLQGAFAGLPDETLLYPTHGGGSFCSTGAGGDRASTLGRERRENPLLSLSDEAEFVSWFPTTFPAVPNYFFRLRPINQAGPRLVREIAMPVALDADAFASLVPQATVVDVRSKEDFARGHIPGSLSNTLRDVYPIWLGWLVPATASLLFVTDDTSVMRIVEESLLVGYENFAGWLQGGIAAWRASGRPLHSFELADAKQAHRLVVSGASVVDVREANEYSAGHIEGAIHVPLGEVARRIDLVPLDRPVVVYCGHGERSSTAISLLESAGLEDLVNLDGGFGAWRDEGFAVAET